MCKMRGEWSDDKDDIFIPVADIRTDVSQQSEKQSNMKNKCHVQAWKRVVFYLISSQWLLD